RGEGVANGFHGCRGEAFAWLSSHMPIQSCKCFAHAESPRNRRCDRAIDAIDAGRSICTLSSQSERRSCKCFARHESTMKSLMPTVSPMRSMQGEAFADRDCYPIGIAANASPLRFH